MTEQNVHPQGEPYGLAMALLHQATALPAAVVIHPDNVLRPFTSDSLSPQHFQLHEQASAILGALRAQQVPLALLVPARSEQMVRSCLKAAGLLAQFKSVVHYQEADDQQQQQQQQGRQGQQSANVAGGTNSSSWAAAANTLKSQIGGPWSQMLFFSTEPLAIRQANRLGMASVRVSAASGLRIEDLRAGLEVFSCKLESDRGY